MSVAGAAPRDEELLVWARRGRIVTRTDRLAREIRARLADALAASGTTVFETPDVLPIDPWLEQLWESSEPEALLLSPSCERVLWQEIIEADGASAAPSAAGLTLLAQSAMSAWSRICSWYEPAWRDFETIVEVSAFARWVSTFRARLSAERWITSAQLAGVLADACAAGRVSEHDPVTLVGFERMEPAAHRLIEALRAAGVPVDVAAAAASSRAATSLWALADADSEVRWVAASIRRDLELRPGISIGVLATDLSAYRQTLERHLTCELDPLSVVPRPGEPLPRLRRVFDLAGAPALAEHGIVGHALDLLRLRARANELELVGRILLAPYPRDADAQIGARRAELQAGIEAALRRENLLVVDLALFAEAAKRAGALELQRSLAKLTTLLQKRPRRAGPSVWAAHFVERLRCFDWPGAAIDRDGDEGVAYARWREAIEALAALDSVRPSMDSDEAVAELEQLCTETIVQAASDGLNVQAMGLLDASGLRFDKTYVLGMTADRFPAPARPHPLLPALWQRRMAMPLSSPEIEAEFAQAVWDRVASSTDELIVTSPRHGDNGEALVVSPLVRRASDREESLESVEVRPWYATHASAAPVFDEPDDGYVPPARVRRGGTSLVGDHSACPFKSFASRRLAVDGLEEPEPEPSARMRGELVHHTLERVWHELGDSGALRALDDDRLATFVRDTAAAVVGATSFVRAAAAGVEPLIDWITEQTVAWLRHERDGEREPWKLAALEEHAEVPLGDHDGGPAVVLRGLRVDRVDELSDGSVLVIDYKTSSSAKKAKSWEGERPEEPQLPIYAVALTELDRRVAGLAFANLVGRDDVGFSGLSGSVIVRGEIEPKRPRKGSEPDPDWQGMDAQIAAWREALAALAEDYAAGNARVDPRNPSLDCRFCGRDPLCRRFELDVESGDDDAGARNG